MGYDLILAIIFYVIIYGYFFFNKNKFEIQGGIFVLYKTKLGLKLMNWFACKFPRFLNILGYVHIVIGFLGMAFIFYFLFKGTIDLLLKPGSPPILAPVLPGVQVAPGIPILGFWHWIIGILIIAVIHEFMHGVYANLYKIKVKSSGFAFLGPLLAAFVEPDEKQMNKKSKGQQLSVLSAGPVSNIWFAALAFILLLFVFNPIAGNVVESKNLVILGLDETLPVYGSGLKIGDKIIKINSNEVTQSTDLLNILKISKPGESIIIETQNGKYTTTLGANKNGETVLGVSVGSENGIKENINGFNKVLVQIFLWLMKLTFWLFIISFGVGLFNLLPLGPVDGGKMFYLAALAVFKDDRKAKKLFSFVTWLVVLLIFINLWPFIVKLFLWLMNLF